MCEPKSNENLNITKGFFKMNKSMKKKALVSSILTIALCLSVIAGATFALFTSDSAVNIAVTSGKVELVANIVKDSLKLSSLGVEQNGKFAAGGTATFDVEDDDLVLANIVPGDKATFDIKVTNDSTVDVQYKVKWTVNGELMGALVASADEKDLTDVTWTPWLTTDAKEKTIKVAVELPREVNNDYQDKGAEITFAVEAIQANAIAEEVETADQLVAALENGAASVTLKNDITLTETIDIPEDAITTLVLNGNTISYENGAAIVNKGNLTIVDSATMTLSAEETNTVGAIIATSAYAIENTGTLTINDANISGLGGIRSKSGTLTIYGGNYTASSDWNKDTYNHIIKAENTKTVIYGGNFDGTIGGTTNALINVSGSTVMTVNGGTFKNVEGDIPNYPPYLFTYEDGGKLIINDGNFYGGWRFNFKATTDIYGGTFAIKTDGQSFQLGNPHVLNIYGGTFNTTYFTQLETYVAEYFVANLNDDGTYTVAQDPAVIFVNGDDELAAALAVIQAGSAVSTFSVDDTTEDKPYWNTNMTIVLAEGIYSGDYSINQYPEWNGVVGRGADGNNMSTVDANDNLALITLVGAGDVIFTGNVTVNGFGDAQSTNDFSGAYDRAATKFDNITFDASTNTDDKIALYVKAAANNVTFANCTFQNATHVTLGANGSNRIGEVIIDGCEFINGNCLSGYVRTLSVTNSTATNAYNGFINVQGTSDVTVEDCTVDCSEYFVRTNSGANVIATGTEIDVKAANGLCVIANLRGASVADFVNCNLNTVMTAGTGTVKINGVEQVKAAASDNTSLDAAIEGGNNVIVLGDGEYIIPDSAQGKTLTIIGNGNTTVASQDDGAAEGDCDYSLSGSTVTFENVTITTSTTYFPGYAGVKATYNNCTINGVWSLYDNSTFNNCTFNVSGDVYNVWTWGAAEATFNGCTFNNDGKALLLYGGVNTKLTLNDCVFNDKGGLTDLKAAVEIGNDYGNSYELIVNNAVVNGYEINDNGINTGTTLWGNKNSMGPDKLNVVIDGVDVY